jgi:hypothetical protein
MTLKGNEEIDHGSLPSRQHTSCHDDGIVVKALSTDTVAQTALRSDNRSQLLVMISSATVAASSGD